MYTVGLDVGSTTIKAVVLDEENNIVYKSYQRHRALIKEKASMMLREVSDFLLGRHGHGREICDSFCAGGNCDADSGRKLSEND